MAPPENIADPFMYYAANAQALSAVAGRIGLLTDGRVPRIVAVQPPGGEAQIIEGGATPQKIAHQFPDTPLPAAVLSQLAASDNHMHASLASVYIEATVGLANLGERLSPAGQLFQLEGLAERMPPTNYNFAVYQVAKIRVPTGALATCTSVSLDGWKQQADEVSHHMLSITDGTVDQTLSIFTEGGTIGYADYAVTGDLKSAPARRFAELLGQPGSTHGLVADGTDTRPHVTDRLAQHLQGKVYSAALAQEIGGVVRQLSAQAATVQRVREETLLQLTYNNSVPTPATIVALGRLIGAAVGDH